MRWFVEVASSSQPEGEKWVVEAAQWQPALQAARSLRGETVEMAGFSIELLEDGFRAVDPATFVRYIVRRAPDNTPISNPRTRPPQAHKQNGGSAPSASGSAGASEPPAVSRAARIAAALDIGGARSSVAPSNSTVPEGSTRSASSPPPAQSRAPQAQRPWSQPGAPRPNTAPRPASQPPPAGSWRASAPDLGSAARKSAPDLSNPARASSPDLANARKSAPDLAARRSSPELAPSRASSPDLHPPAELLLQREEDPSPTSPLTYRETVWVVPPGTSSEAAVRLLVGMFEGVRAALAGAKPGKLVNMAIFDHRFQGKPQAPPLATLTWKDWKDKGQGPDIRRQGDPPVSMRPSAISSLPPEIAAPPAPQVAPSVPPPAMASAPPPAAPSVQAPVLNAPPSVVPSQVVAVGVASMVPQPPIGSPAPPLIVAGQVAVSAPAAPPANLGSYAPPVAPPAVIAPAPVSAPPIGSPAPAPFVSAPPIGSPAPAPFVPAPPIGSPAPAPFVSAPPIGSPAPAPFVPAPPIGSPAPAPFVSAPPIGSPAPASFVPAPVPVAPAPQAPIPPRAPDAFAPTFADPEPVAISRTPSVPRIRLSGVELITDLFEAMHELHFLRDSLEGADFVLALVMEKLPSMVGLVHFYDINAREFVVVRTVGPGAAKALQIRTNEKDPLIADAMRSHRAVVIDDATTDPRAQSGRWALIGASRSLVVAPVEQAGRFLGLLELANPKDGGPFHETDGHALTYMGEQFAEFLATRGLILDPERIGGR